MYFREVSRPFGLVLCAVSVVALGVLLGAAGARAEAEAAAPDPDLFTHEILPIFSARCCTCHGAEKQKGGLRLDLPECIEKGGEDGPVVVAGKPEESKLLHLVTLPAGDPDIMPAKGDPLTKEQTDVIRKWIEQGAGLGNGKSSAPAPVPVQEAAQEPAQQAAREPALAPPPQAQEPVKETDSSTLAPPSSSSSGAEVLFNRDIRPILSNNCYLCHGPDKNRRKANLRLDNSEDALAEREGKRAIVPGDSAHSELVRRICHTDPSERMPPADAERSLTPDQVALLVRWIDEGARYQAHWAYIPPLRAAPPAVQHADRVQNPIDQFIFAQLEEKGLDPSPEADRTTLIRRLSFDLVGLPPTPADVDAFVNDTAPDAYERLVDRLLASPHYGERMAIYWLDQVRYADTNGYHSDEFRSIFPYRDYVVKAFNDNRPFDQFTRQQLAGDLLANASVEDKVASGYNRLNQITAEGGAQEKEYLAIYAADRVRTTSSVWMGATMGCAQCHDHKFDPYTTKDFYSFEAFFADVQEKGVYEGGSDWGPKMDLPSESQAAQLAALEERITGLQTTLNTPTDALATAQQDWEARARTELAVAQNNWTPLMPASALSAGGATLTAQQDSAVLASGQNPNTDIYVVTFPTDQRRITGLRLEALLHASIPQGLSRANGNFILSEFEVSTGVEGASVPIAKAQADYEQEGHSVADALDGKPDTGWAVAGHELKGAEHQAVFTFEKPIEGGPGTELTVRLKFESTFPQHALSCFRISLTTTDHPPLLQTHKMDKDVFQALWLDPGRRSTTDQEKLAAYYRSIAPELAEARAQWKAATEQKASLQKEIPSTLVTAAVPPRPIRVLPRGNWLDDSGEVAPAAVPHFLPQLNTGERPANRLDLADWLLAPENPLTARVTVNQLWKMFFGTGISKVLNDLGAQGEWPTHPELLDWLAVEFRESGWDLKHMIKLMVMSETYRQSSLGTPALLAMDPQNRLYARQARFRLPAELVRDNALAVSGLLSPTIGGRSVFPYQPDGYWDSCNTFRGPLIYTTDKGEDQYRRGVYTIWKRSFLHPSLLAFDAPSREECTAERVSSNTPLQALVLLNDPSYVEAARVFAARILKEGGATVPERLAFAYRQALSRLPTQAEEQVLTQLCTKHYEEYKANPDAAKQALQEGQAPTPEDVDPAELAAWTSVARAILNLHETITRS